VTCCGAVVVVARARARDRHPDQQIRTAGRRAELREVPARIPKRSPTVLTNSRGRPWKTGTGSIRAKKKAGIGELHFHDLRGTRPSRFRQAAQFRIGPHRCHSLIAEFPFDPVGPKNECSVSVIFPNISAAQRLCTIPLASAFAKSSAAFARKCALASVLISENAHQRGPVAFGLQLANDSFAGFALRQQYDGEATRVANSVWVYVIFPSPRVRPGLLSSCGVIGSSSLFGMIAVLRSNRR
jgi:hypothetical protein